jgi:hypothetical protein
MPKSGREFFVNDFVKGFAGGFGSVGCVFNIPRQTPLKTSLARRLAQAPALQRNKIAAMAKEKIAIKYVGEVAASKLCSISAETRKGRARRRDGLMIYQGLAAANSKIHG